MTHKKPNFSAFQQYIRKMKKLLFLTITFCITSAFAQNVEFSKSNFPEDKNKFKDAVSALKEGDFHFYEGPDITTIMPYLNILESL